MTSIVVKPHIAVILIYIITFSLEIVKQSVEDNLFISG